MLGFTSFALLALAAFLFTAAAAQPAQGAAGATGQGAQPSTSGLAGQISGLIDLLRQHVAATVIAGVVVLVALFVAFVYYSRQSTSVSLAWGFAKFELSDAIRKVQDELDDARADCHVYVRVVNDFRLLSSSLSDLAAHPTRDEVRRFLGLCAESTQQMLRSYKASVWLCDDEAKKLRIYAGQRVSSRTLRDFFLSLTPDGFEGFAGHVYNTGKPLWLDEPAQRPDIFKRDATTAERVGPIIGVPILGTDHKPLGVLCATHHVDAGLVFTADNAAMAAVYADLASAALQLGRLAQVELWRGLNYP